MRIEALGVPIEVVAADADRPRLARQWARCRTGREPAATLTHSAAATPDLSGPDAADHALAATATITGLEAGFGHRIAFHAAGLVAPTGAVLTLVAGTGAGKSTATRVLGRRLGYLSDETVSVDPATLEVLPYPKPVSLLAEGAGAEAAKAQHGPDDLGLLPLPAAAARLGRLVLLDRSPDLAPTEVRIEPVPLLDALIALVPHTSALPRLRDPLAALARLVSGTGGAVRVRYCEIDAAADALVALVGEGAADAGGASKDGAHTDVVHVAATPGAPPPADRLPASTDEAPWTPDAPLRRTPHTDAVAQADDAVVLVGQQAFRLTGAAAAAWLALPDDGTEMSLADLGQVLVDDLGADPRAAEHTVRAVTLLADAGLVNRPIGEPMDADPTIGGARG